MTDKIDDEFEFDKETPGTWRFKSTQEDSVIKTLYISKAAKLKNPEKSKLKVVITVE